MENNGFVKLPRNFLEWEWFDDANTLKVYLALICLASFKDCRLKGYELKRGQAPVSLEILARRTNMTIRSVRTALKHLEMSGDIEIVHTNKFSVVTVKNYDCNAGLGDFFAPEVTVDRQADENSLTAPSQPIESHRAVVEEVKEIQEKKECEQVKKSAPTRDDLISTYGIENVQLYEQKFDEWTAKKGITGINEYPTIAKWMQQDNVSQDSGSFGSINYDEVIQKLKSRYRNCANNPE